MLKYSITIKYLVINDMNDTIFDFYVEDNIFILAFNHLIICQYPTKFAVVPFINT